MRTFKNQAAQGDTLYRLISEIPNGSTLVDKWDGVVAHSETGHNHAFRSSDLGAAKFYRNDNDPMVCYLRLESEALLEHHRSFDTHAPILFPPGLYEVRRQREHTPDGWRRIED